jgi:hypothetical protein
MATLLAFARRALFVVAVVLAGLAVWEKLANLFDRTLVFLASYPPARLLEVTVVVLLFVIALELREIRHQGRTRAA